MGEKQIFIIAVVCLFISVFLLMFCVGMMNYDEHDFIEDMYQQRLDSMDIVSEKIFPVHNQTVIITNEGYIPSEWDWVNDTKFGGGWVIRVNNSVLGVQDYIFDGWVLRELDNR